MMCPSVFIDRSRILRSNFTDRYPALSEATCERRPLFTDQSSVKRFLPPGDRKSHKTIYFLA